MNLIKSYTLIILFIIISASAFAQRDSLNIEQMTREEILNLTQDELLEMSFEDLIVLANKLGISIDELLNIKVTTGSKSMLTPRETPGIISVITEEEITLSGARDMIDILRLVPGFDFGYDVQGVIGAGLRGNWVHEGKILMMIDGQQLNELSYYNLAFGNHIPLDQIQRIEIIRGPGSAVYGGIAELGVINVITKNGSDIQGIESSLTYGRLPNNPGRLNLNLNTGVLLKDWDFSAKGFIGTANRSDQSYAETFDDIDYPVELSDGGSEIETRHLNVGASNSDISFRFVYDDYKTRYASYIDSAIGNTAQFNEFRSILGELKYNLKINDKIIIQPVFNFKYSRPYYEEDYWRNFYVNRFVGNINIKYNRSSRSSYTAGIEFMNDQGQCIEDTGYFIINNKNRITISNASAFAEGLFKLGRINLIAGGRIENNSEYGFAGAPRIGITGIFNNFHFKALFSGAFRSPAIGNIDVGNDIKPEQSYVTEFELGYKINDNMFVTSNFYDIKINNTIIYFDNGGYDAGTDWGYTNAAASGSDGFEVEYKAKYLKGYFALNYSFYTVALRKIPDSYSVPEDNSRALGLSQNKIGINGNYMIFKNFYANPSVTVMGKKYAYKTLDDEENPLIHQFNKSFLLNMALTYDDFLIKGLGFTISVYDILNQKPSFPQPYNGWYLPYPGRSRELLFKIYFKI